MRFILLFTVLALVSLAGCMGPRQAQGAGVDIRVLNLQSLGDVYFQYYRGMEPTSPDELQLNQDGDLVSLFEINTLVHNRGYADTLAALYVTGYDPNLFVVEPLGPYRMNVDPQSCWRDITLVDGSWSAYEICQTADDLRLGGGLRGDGDDIEGFRADVYNANIREWIKKVPFGIGEAIASSGLADDISVTCVGDKDGDKRSSAEVRPTIGDFVINCDISLGNPVSYFQRSSRGALALALYGDKLRSCANGCVPVPASLLADEFISGNNELYPGGEASQVDFGVYLNRGRWPANLNDHEQLFQITACYLYTTYATPKVCIDPTPGSSDGEVCRPGILEMITQPAPLSITRIEQVNQGPRVMFTIHVQNSLPGRVFEPGAIDYCSPAAPETFARELRDTAKLIDARVLGSLDSLDCRDGLIHINEGRGQITCYYDLPPESWNRPAYQTTLNIEIAYLYREIETVRSAIHRI